MARFANEDWSQRSRALEELLRLVPHEARSWWVPPAVAALLAAAPTRADDIKIAVIRLLEQENVALSTVGIGGASEERSEFLAALVSAVGEFRDPRAVAALVHNIGTGNIATNGIAALGRHAIGAVEEELGRATPARSSGSPRLTG